MIGQVRGYRYKQAARGRQKGLPHSIRERIGGRVVPSLRERIKSRDHSEERPEQSHERCDLRDRGNKTKAAFERGNLDDSRGLNSITHFIRIVVRVQESGL